MGRDVLPSSVTKARTGRVFHSTLGPLIPVYCASCSALWGLVQERLLTFAFVVCNACEAKNGPIAGLMSEPDEVFRERQAAAVADEERRAGRALSALEVEARMRDGDGPLALVSREWQAHVRKVATP